ncbi:MGH1-like glycoside hydrolase domain-containing protein [Actinosynnema pretiosum]|uniref:F5/8 type C domain-containing protein n=2 Tax=Actinosynnema TaxID=40566 RepID=A0A290ZA77_9PSEU|nr:discoidin domain-containing protein [Actinosynnema pretiosum]ATE55941.1 hypothetical protein CNX65_23875 [Actinosynnema pretiosum]
MRLRTAVLVALTATAVLTPLPASAAPAAPWYPPVGPGTSVLDHRAKLAGAVEPQWYEANIPFVDLPDREIESTYYYRWRTFKEALKHTGPDDGWIVSEFLGPVGYSAPGGGIAAAAGHHVYEGRWLRDHRYLDDYLDYWLRGGGAGPKPATEFLNPNTADWAHQYSFWAADAVLARAAVDGRLERAVALLPELERQWAGWDAQRDRGTGLYWQTPVWDAMEHTASSYQSDDPYHGGEGFRPTLNAYQYGDAKAIAALLRARGDRVAAERYEREAGALRDAVRRHLWDREDGFYKHVMRDGNPGLAPLADREQIGFVPWYFGMPPAEHSSAWAQLTDRAGFAADFGPTTVERRSPWYLHDAEEGCCRWSGPSWPFATSQTLTALANLLVDYPAQSFVDKGDYCDVLRGYALTQRKGGQPYVAEAHHPDQDRWLYDGRGHSEDYNHSTFTDLVLSGLLGIRPEQGDSVRIAPLVPDGWDHFAAENVPYHGRNLTVLWDRDGRAYGRSAGLRVFVDGVQAHAQRDLGPVRVPLRRGAPAELPRLVDDLANPSGTGFPAATASHTWHADSPADAIDGQDFHLDVPSTRWTSYGSPNRADWLAVDLGAATVVSDVRVSFYDDGGGVRTPDAFALERRDASGAWVEVPGQRRTPAVPERGRVNRVVVDPPVRADALRLRATRSDGGAVGVTAWQSWRREDDRVFAALDGLRDGVIPVRAGGEAEVGATVRGSARAELLAPAGWTVSPLPRRADGFRWRVGAPASLTPGDRAPLRLLVTTGRGATSAVAQAEARFDPADYGRVVWDDDFSRWRDYRVGARFGEPAPELVADGGLTASASRQSSAVLVAPVTAPAGEVAVVLEPGEFAGAAPEDSVLVGLAAGGEDLALSWYNHSGRSSGVDVRVDGRDAGAATGGCCADVVWQPGDRFAAVFGERAMTTWVERAGQWRRLRGAPYATAVSPERRATWSPALGVRLTGGGLSLNRVTALSRG